MENTLIHEIELYSADNFRTLLDHEVQMSRRYGHPVTLIHLAVETDSDDPYAQHGAEIFAINALNLHLRDTDIPCKKGNEFLVIMPSTDEQGGRIVSERLETIFRTEPQLYDKVSFKLSAFIGMASLSGDRAGSGKILMQNASEALEHARENRLVNSVIFSDMKK
jgi:diguanylate cyclase (GGDEF)-like protein